MAGRIITSDYGSFPHSLLSTSKKDVFFFRFVVERQNVLIRRTYEEIRYNIHI